MKSPDESAHNPAQQTPDGAPAPFSLIELTGPGPAIDAEFKARDATPVFSQYGLPMGRCFGSKSGYRSAKPKSTKVQSERIVAFNANVFSLRAGKIWWGDLDIARDASALEQVAKELRCRLYVLREGDGRFENAQLPEKKILERAIWQTGGPALVPGVAHFLATSGLTPSQASVIAKLERGRLTRPQAADLVLKIRRRLVRYEEVFTPVAQKLGHAKWGQWWAAANEKLAGKSPIEAIEAGETIDLQELLGELMGSDWLLQCWELVTCLHGRL
jgi:hypothetical protein